MQSIPDEAMIVRYLHREDTKAHTAMGWVMDLYGKRLYASIRRWTKNHDATNDVLQEVFFKIWKNRLQFQGNSALYSWIYRIAYNETLLYLQKENKHLALDIDAPLVSFSHKSEHYGKISAEEISSLLDEALQTLPVKQRLIFELKYFEDLKYEEIVARVGGTVGGQKANYFHAVAKIETFLRTRLNQL